MKPYLNPIPIACLIIAIGAAVVSSYAVLAAALIAGIASIGFISARNVQSERSGDPAESLSNEGKTLLRPVRRLTDEIRAMVDANRESPTITVIGGEAIQESDRLIGQVARSLQIRDDLKRSLRGRYQAEKEIGESRMRLEFATGTERQSLQSAIDARTTELAHYADIEKHLSQIERGVHQAEAVLAEIKAKLSLSRSQDQAALGPADDLRDTLGRMRSLSESYKEAEQVVKGDLRT